MIQKHHVVTHIQTIPYYKSTLITETTKRYVVSY